MLAVRALDDIIFVVLIMLAPTPLFGQHYSDVGLPYAWD